MTDFRKQAIRDVAAFTDSDENLIAAWVASARCPLLLSKEAAMAYAVLQRERVLELEAERTEQNRVIGNLAMLVRRMARRMRKTSRSWDGDQNLVKSALQYLDDHDLQGGVLRDAALKNRLADMEDPPAMYRAP